MFLWMAEEGNGTEYSVFGCRRYCVKWHIGKYERNSVCGSENMAVARFDDA